VKISDQYGLLTKEELRTRLNLPSIAMVEQLMRTKKIPYIKLGYRTVRFDWPKIQSALEKLTILEARQR